MLAWAATDGLTSQRGAAVTLALALGLAGGVGLLRAGPRFRGTTLAAPWRWACFSFAMFAACEAWVALLATEPSPGWVAHARYLAGVTSLAPYVALLGAKRPQDRAWQLIVAALLLLLALPSGKALAFDSGAPPAPHAAWRLLLAILLISQLINHLPTRFWPTALLISLSQLTWLVGYLPGVAEPGVAHWPLAGLALATAAIWLCSASRGRRSAPGRSRGPIDRVWLDFRDDYGALWSLRVAERFNSSATLYGWPARLGWDGLREEKNRRKKKGERKKDDCRGHEANEGEDNVTAAMHQNLKTLLWRFVSPVWIDDRLGTQGTPGLSVAIAPGTETDVVRAPRL